MDIWCACFNKPHSHRTSTRPLPQALHGDTPECWEHSLYKELIKPIVNSCVEAARFHKCRHPTRPQTQLTYEKKTPVADAIQ